MAIINCPDCGNQISDKAKRCVHCGKIFESVDTQTNDIIVCEECGASFHKEMEECPNCGCPISLNPKFKPKKKTMILICSIIGVVLIALIGTLMYSFAPQQSQHLLADKPQSKTERKATEYVDVICTYKTNMPMNAYENLYSDYVKFDFDVTNKSDKAIKGIEGILIIKDLFGKEIQRMECDFTGKTIEANSTTKFSDLAKSCFPQVDEADNKLYSTDFNDLQFSYDVSKIVFSDGSTVSL